MSSNRKIKLNKDYYIVLLKISIPLGIQNLLISSFGFVDQAMLSGLGTDAIVCVGISFKIVNLFTITNTALGMCVGILVSQFQERNIKEVRSVLKYAMILGIILAIFMTMVCLIVPEIPLKWFTRDSSIIELAKDYMKIYGIGFIFIVLKILISVVLKNLRRIKEMLLMSILALVLNTTLNALLINGIFIFPKMGVKGAAFATVISNIFEGVGLLVLLKKLIGFGLNDIFKEQVQKKFAKTILVVLCPLLINEILWGISDLLYSIIYSNTGKYEMAAMMLTNPLQSACIGIFVGISSGAGITIGNCLGERKEEDAYDKAKKSLKLTFFISVTMGALVIGLSSPYLWIYDVESAVTLITKQILVLYSISLVFKALDIIFCSIIRSGAETKVTFWIDLIGSWGIGIPLALWLGYGLHAPLQIIYLAIIADDVIRCIISFIYFKNKKWCKSIVASQNTKNEKLVFFTK